VTSTRITRILLLACFSVFVLVVEFRRSGFQPIFTVMVLGVTLWAGYHLWREPKRGASGRSGGDGGPDGGGESGDDGGGGDGGGNGGD
jgi:hypothetical protein